VVVPTISELKEQAATFEEQGQPARAIAIYQHVLNHLQDAPEELAEELALYVRIGDLHVELRHPARAFALYQQAAEHYARLGSAEPIKMLCARMINVVPAAGDSYARYARRLLDYGHADSALIVIDEYATRADLEDVSDAIGELREGPSDELRSAVAELLQQVEVDAKGHALVARRVSAEMAVVPEPTPARQQPEFAVPFSLDQSQPPVTPRSQGKRAAPKAPPVAAPRATDDLGVRPSPATQGDSRLKTTRVWGGKAGGWNRLVRRLTESPIPWGKVGIGSAVVGGAGVLIVGLASIAGGSRGSSPPPVIAAALDTSPGSIDGGTAAAAVEEGEESTPPAVVPEPPPPTRAPEPQASRQPEATVPEAPPESPAAAVIPMDSIDQLALPDTADFSTDTLSADTADASVAITEPIILDSAAIQSVTEVEFRGQRGYRVVHLLDSGTEFVVESFPVDTGSARRYPLGTVVTNLVPPDTTVSIVRFDERYLVFASGVVPEDSVRVLLGRLRVRESPNQD
jgi:hypothetical protein